MRLISAGSLVRAQSGPFFTGFRPFLAINSAHRFFLGKATLSALQDPLIRDYISPEKFARLCSRHGITPDTTCIFYGDA
jgi:hypothetical protein